MNTNLPISATQASDLLARQLKTWPLAQTNYAALERMQVKSFEMDGYTIRIQFNPARIVSTGAKVDARSLREHPCFLCLDHLPMEQERLPFGADYLILCNPFPIFPQHFTIPTRRHTPQRILPQLDAMLELTRQLAPFTLFYNGPRCGASAPDHAHFQAVSRGIMPMDQEVERWLSGQMPTPLPYKTIGEGRIYRLTDYLRNGFILEAHTLETTRRLFHTVYAALPIPPGVEEPMMNLFGSYIDHRWILTLIPRKRHRPWQYTATGEDHLLSSPGAADIGGLFITPLEKDFRKITPELVRDVYQQICWRGQEITELFVHLPSN